MITTKEQNKKLVEEYPFLLPRNVFSDEIDEDYDYEFTWLDEMPDIWRIKFSEQMLKELKEILIEGDYLYDYRICQIKEKFACYDDKTEVLTENGWKFFRNITPEDKLATLATDGETLVYENPTDVISYKYEGKMYHLENRGVNLLVTPNHKLYVSKGSYFNGKKNNEKRTYPFEFATPETYFGKDKRFKKGCLWNGKIESETFHIPGYQYTNYMSLQNCNRTYKQKDLDFPIIPFLRFLGFYVAEGHSCIRKGQGSDISVAYNPADEEELVCKLISDLGFRIRARGKGQKRIGNKTLALFLKENAGHLAPNKKVPPFIKKLPPFYIEEFLKFLFIGDGHKTKTSNILTTVSKQLSDDVQELLLKAGYCFRESSREPQKSNNRIQSKLRRYDINWLKTNEVEIDNSKTKNIKSFKEEWVDYSGMVYCATVSSHLLYVRRDGKGVWCGNSLRWYDNGVPDKIYDKYWAWISKYEKMSESICFYCGEPAVGQTRGWILSICQKCADKKNEDIWYFGEKEDEI